MQEFDEIDRKKEVRKTVILSVLATLAVSAAYVVGLIAFLK